MEWVSYDRRRPEEGEAAVSRGGLHGVSQTVYRVGDIRKGTLLSVMEFLYTGALAQRGPADPVEAAELLHTAEFKYSCVGGNTSVC